ncbi:hypothetical protein [Streptomyces sp. NPDC056683]|uniref:hypothetical protein n=1 Tax=Streptomyces sp. NPDC056683 TaxID=3345910 RepID=UPI00369A1769
MSATMPNVKGPAPIQLTTEAAELGLVPASEVKPEEIATLSIEYRDGEPVIVATGGKYVPASLNLAGTSTRFTWEDDDEDAEAAPQRPSVVLAITAIVKSSR